MKKLRKGGASTDKFLAVLLVSAAILGWLISLSGLVLLWMSYQPVRQTAVLRMTPGGTGKPA